MYSIGNELSEPYEQRGLKITEEVVDYLHSLDGNRAVTGGINIFLIYMASKGIGIFKEEERTLGANSKKKKKPIISGSLFFNIVANFIGPVISKIPNLPGADKVSSPCLDALDIAGYNYAAGRYPIESKKHPNRVIVGTETFHKDLARNWDLVKKYPYVVGDFMWTAWDYLGEASIGAWAYDGSAIMNKPYPWLTSECGAIDILGNPGAPAQYAAVVWGLAERPFIGVRPVNHPGIRPTRGLWRGTNAVDSWSWKNCDGNQAEIEVFADAYEVELFLNERSLGRKKIKAYKTLYKVSYMPGTLKAVAYDQNGGKLSERTLTSATGRIGISLEPEQARVKAGELVYVKIHLVGENGVVESNDDKKLSVSVEGGDLLGFGSANPRTQERFDRGNYTTYYGKALAVIRAGLNSENVYLTVSGEGCELQELSLPVDRRD